MNSGSWILKILLVALIFITWAVAGVGYASAAERHVYPGQSIQTSINNADVDDTICVHAGTYVETVNVNKRVTLMGIGKPVVDASGSGSAITLNANAIKVDGFTAINSASGYPNAGISVSSNNNIVINNTASNNTYGIYLLDSNNNVLTGNTALNNSDSGIHLYSSSNNILMDNTASNNDEYGIRLYSSSNNNTLTDNTANSNSHNGILLSSSSINTLAGNTANDNEDGIRLYSSSYNTLTGNTASNNSNHGIRLYSSSYNNLTDNNALNNTWGISMVSSSINNRVIDNSFSNNGLIVVSSYQNTVENNIVNGKPLVYLEDAADETVIAAGQVILVNCDNITVNHLDVSHASVGVELWNSDNCKVLNNTASNNAYGIFLSSSSTNNNLTDNTVSNNFAAIALNSSSYNSLTDNTVSNNVWGIYLGSSSNNNLTGNTASNNTIGIYLFFSGDNNHIYNNYFDNTNNAQDDGTNIWNISKTSGTNIIGGPWLGGNYWSDYNGTDADGDGFGDTSYDNPGGTNKDYLPLVAPRIFDTGKGEYPSITGTHNGTIRPCQDIVVSNLYTYPCPGTGGHTEYVKIWNSTWNATATWNGYIGDWHNISFDESFPASVNQTCDANPLDRGGGGGAAGSGGFTLYANETYNYTIRTGSYPQIIHEPSWNAIGGIITCTEFVDINGKRHENWIPAIRLGRGGSAQQDVLRLNEDTSYVLNLETGSKQTYIGFLNSTQFEADRLEFSIYVSKTGNPILDTYVLELRTNLDNPEWKFGDDIYHAANVLVWKGTEAHEAPVPKIVLSGVVPKPGGVYVELTVGTTKDGVTLATIIQKLEPLMTFFSIAPQ
jgi:parallel beta-helix repeat protein